MFYRFKWLEMLYLLSGHVVVCSALAVFLFHALSLTDNQLRALQAALGANVLWCLALLSVFAACILGFAMLCSAAPLLQMCGQYKAAESLYALTLRLRSSLPIIGTSARTSVWNVSLANCLRELGRTEEAEDLYKAVLHRVGGTTFIDRWTHYGLKAVAWENYAVLLERSGRQAEAESMKTQIDQSLTILRVKYASISFLVLLGGLAFVLWQNAELTAIRNAIFKS